MIVFNYLSIIQEIVTLFFKFGPDQKWFVYSPNNEKRITFYLDQFDENEVCSIPDYRHSI